MRGRARTSDVRQPMPSRGWHPSISRLVVTAEMSQHSTRAALRNRRMKEKAAEDVGNKANRRKQRDGGNGQPHGLLSSRAGGLRKLVARPDRSRLANPSGEPSAWLATC